MTGSDRCWPFIPSPTARKRDRLDQSATCLWRTHKPCSHWSVAFVDDVSNFNWSVPDMDSPKKDNDPSKLGSLARFGRMALAQILRSFIAMGIRDDQLYRSTKWGVKSEVGTGEFVLDSHPYSPVIAAWCWEE